MPINIEDIKKLPPEEKLKLIDELWKSMEDDDLETEEDAIIRERMEAYEQGKLTFVSWDEAKARIEERLKEMRRAKQ